MQALVTSKDVGDRQVKLSPRNPGKSFTESPPSDQRDFASSANKYTHTSPVAYIDSNRTACTPDRSKGFCIRSPTDALGLRHPDVFIQYRRPKKTRALIYSISSPNSEPGTPSNLQRIRRTCHTQKRLNFMARNPNSDTAAKKTCVQIDDTLQSVLHGFNQLTFDDMSNATGTALVVGTEKQPPLCFAKDSLLKETGGQLSGRYPPVKRRDSAKRCSAPSDGQIKAQLCDRFLPTQPVKRRDSDKEPSSSEKVRDRFLDEFRQTRSLKRRNSCPCPEELEESGTQRLKRKKLNNSASDTSELWQGNATRRKRRKSDSSELCPETVEKHKRSMR